MNSVADLLRRRSLGLASDEDFVRELMESDVWVLATYPSIGDSIIRIQDYVMDGTSFIPVFLDSQVAFRRRSEGELASGELSSNRVVRVKGEALLDLLHGDETLMVDAGEDRATTMYSRDLKALVDRLRNP